MNGKFYELWYIVKKKVNFCELNPKVSKETQTMLKILDLRQALPQFENFYIDRPSQQWQQRNSRLPSRPRKNPTQRINHEYLSII